MRDRLTFALRIARWTGLGLLATIVLFGLSAWIGSSIPRNSDWAEADPDQEATIEILIGDNGIHTEIIMPLVTPEMDWREQFPASDLIAQNANYSHVAVSWGERKFFLETPTWADVDPRTVIGAMIGGEGVLHVAHYVRPAPADDFRPLHLRPDEYAALARQIAQQVEPRETREVLSGYGRNDVFYTAAGTYHIGNTCNQWTSDRLGDAGVKIGRWSPFPGGVMKWVRPLSSD